MPHTIESELLGPTPRKVSARNKAANIGIGCIRVFIFPHMLVGVGMMLAVAGYLIVMAFGSPAKGIVTGKTESTDSDGDITHSIRYRFRVGSEAIDRSDHVDPATYAGIRNEQAVAVRYFPGLPRLYSFALLPGRSMLGTLGFLLLFTVFWNGLLAIFVWMAYVAPFRMRRLYTHGLTATGTVTGKKTMSNEDGRSYSVAYSFVPEALGFQQRIHGKTPTNAVEYEEVEDGQDLTILFDARHPRRSVAYRFGPYEVI